LDDLVTQGKIRYIGCSNLPSWQVVESQWISKSMGLNRFVSCQDEYNILNRNVEAELIPAMQKYGCGLLPYFPLASGLLTGKYKRTKMPEGARLTDMPTFANRIYLTDENFDIIDNLHKFANKTGHSILELAFGWMASRPTTASIIAGATKPEQIDANVAAVNWVLSQSEIDEVNKISDR
jgi:aryl-alcohol dehydrogenase-like predicted oxidoreductase